MALTVYEVSERTADGVPVIAQVVLSKLRVPGRAGVILHEVTAAPRLLIVGVMLSAVPTEPE